MTHRSVTDIMPPMAVRPRIVIEVNSTELNHQLKVKALEQRTTLKGIVLLAIANQYPELKKLVDKESS